VNIKAALFAHLKDHAGLAALISGRKSPSPSGFGPNAVTSTPFRDNSSPACTGGSLPAGPSK
jgi:hypothetical protein